MGLFLSPRGLGGLQLLAPQFPVVGRALEALRGSF